MKKKLLSLLLSTILVLGLAPFTANAISSNMWVLIVAGGGGLSLIHI